MSILKKNIIGKLRAKPNTKIGIVKSAYNSAITDALLKSCVAELKKSGVPEKNIRITEVPGAFELPFGCQKMAKTKKFHAIIALGAVIRGETPHFEFIAQTTANGIMEVSLKFDIPVIFGVLTTNNSKQAKERIKNGKRGDKGVEAAQSALKLIIFSKI